MTAYVAFVFGVVYLGMILGGLPFLQLDRTGVALLGAIALVGAGAVTPDEAVRSLHLPTLILLFSFMVLSAQMRLGGFYNTVAAWASLLPVPPAVMVGALIFVVAGLSAVFTNDIVCLAMAPVLVEGCSRRKLDPVPFLLALACAANIGSAATLIGNPQNMLIGQKLGLSFAAYASEAVLPVAFGLLATWGTVVWRVGGRWRATEAAESYVAEQRQAVGARLDRWQTTKGLAVASSLLVLFLFSSWPREVVALAGAGLLLLSRRLHSSKMLGLVDWELLVLFVGLFVVNHAFQQTGLADMALRQMADLGVRLDQPAVLFGGVFLLSNLVSNVPAVMLLLPVATHPLAGTLLALVSTLAGNLLIVGSIANIIVVDAAARRGIRIGWRRHAAIGVPVTLASLVICAAVLGLRGGVFLAP
ncbi:MAG: SLC13 family permease [Rhodocyclaceae bacterium]